MIVDFQAREFLKVSDKSQNFSKPEPPIAFALPLLFCPLLILAWVYGGIILILAPVFGYVIISIIDFIIGENKKNQIDVSNDTSSYKLILFAWPLIQFFLLFGSLVSICWFNHLTTFEAICLMLVQGMITGAVGITFAHELMHQKTKLERFFSDILMAMAFYGHFRTEHVFVHHRYVGTKKDAVTARFNESFYTFFLRVIPQCLISAWSVEAQKLASKNKSILNISNPFYIYAALACFFVFLSFIVGGAWGIALFFIQALVAVLHLEVVNYIEHYGLSRKKISDNKYEPTKPHHSWNANHAASNLLLINLQKHSDHHSRPSQTYPTLSAHDADSAPQLPFGYPIMVVFSLVPFIWRKVMNPKVIKWRAQFYPEVSEWKGLS